MSFQHHTSTLNRPDQLAHGQMALPVTLSQITLHAALPHPSTNPNRKIYCHSPKQPYYLAFVVPRCRDGAGCGSKSGALIGCHTPRRAVMGVCALPVSGCKGYFAARFAAQGGAEPCGLARLMADGMGLQRDGRGCALLNAGGSRPVPLVSELCCSTSRVPVIATTTTDEERRV